MMSCSVVDGEEPIILRMRRLIQVPHVKCQHAIFCVLPLPGLWVAGSR